MTLVQTNRIINLVDQLFLHNQNFEMAEVATLNVPSSHCRVKMTLKTNMKIWTMLEGLCFCFLVHFWFIFWSPSKSMILLKWIWRRYFWICKANVFKNNLYSLYFEIYLFVLDTRLLYFYLKSTTWLSKPCFIMDWDILVWLEMLQRKSFPVVTVAL